MKAELPQGAAIVVLGPSALPLARRLQRRLPGSEVHVAQGGAIALLKSLFRAHRPIVGICAAGIVIRALAPLLKDKTAEPPVVAMAEDGSVAVPLLGGHHGANAMARAIARATGGTAALTTVSELRLGLALDAPPPGWEIVPTYEAKCLVAYLMSLDQSHPLKEVKTAPGGAAPPAGSPPAAPAGSPAPAPPKK